MTCRRHCWEKPVVLMGCVDPCQYPTVRRFQIGKLGDMQSGDRGFTFHPFVASDRKIPPLRAINAFIGKMG